MTKERTEAEHPEPIVTLAGPADHKDTVYLTEDGPIRFLEGRATVRLSVATKHVRPGWTIEP